jgi:cobalt-zinc-cadmium efflux system outer membrane protein
VQAEREIAAAEAEVANAAANARAAGGPALAAAQEAARIARVGYGQGKFGQLELLEAERTLAETRAAAVDALQSYHNAQARLRRLATPALVASPTGDN